MIISMACDGCGRLLRIKADLAGRKIKCPHCGNVQKVEPQAELAEPAVALAEPAEEPEAAQPPEVLLAQHTARRRRARVVRIAALIGLLYGLASAFVNQNPHYSWFGSGFSAPPGTPLSVINERFDRAAAWRPSPLWLPSYLLCLVRFGIEHERAPGYHFKSVGTAVVYVESSALLGGLLGAGVGAAIAAFMRRRDRTAEPLHLSPGSLLAAAGWLVLSLFCGFVCFAVGFGIASIGARGAVQEDARGLPVGFNAALLGLFVPTLFRRWRRG